MKAEFEFEKLNLKKYVEGHGRNWERRLWCSWEGRVRKLVWDEPTTLCNTYMEMFAERKAGLEVIKTGKCSQRIDN